MGHAVDLPVRAKETDAMAERQGNPPVEFGKPCRELFLFDPSFRNMNHGSFGTIPRPIQARQRHYQDLAEARPDPFIRYEFPVLLDASRAAVAQLLHAPVDTVVFVPNATVGVNVVLRAIEWDADGADEILYFATIYGACGRTIDYIVERASYGRVSSRAVELAYPLDDAAVVAAFTAAVAASRAAGRRPRICIFDTVSSVPGVRVPFEALTAACRAEGILSLVDGAQGVGMVDLDLTALDPDFFVTNSHKWLFVPRACAALCVPLRNQHLLPSTVPTSHGYVHRDPATARFSPLPPSAKSAFVNNFEFTGTLDNTAYACVADAIRWRDEVLGGEARIRDYLRYLARDGGRMVAEILGTHIMENAAGTLVDCAMVNIALPLAIAPDADTRDDEAQDTAGLPSIARNEAFGATQWMIETMMHEHKTYTVLFAYRGRWWTRLSAQVYLDADDFEFTGQALKEVCERAAKGEYKEKKGEVDAASA